MMSVPTTEGLSPHYDTVISSTPSAVQLSNVPLALNLNNANPLTPVYYVPSSNQMHSIPTVTPQYNVTTILPQHADRSSPFFKTFLKGKPQALGILVICAAILEIVFGIGQFFTIYTFILPSGILFWGPVFYIIAGSLTVAAYSNPNVCLVRGSLSLNIISCIFSMIAVILNAIDLATVHCYYYSSHYWNNDYEAKNRACQEKLAGSYAVRSILLIINLLILCVTFSSSIFGCRSLSKLNNISQVFIIQNDILVSMNPGNAPVPATYVQPPPAPPPYSVNIVKSMPMQ